MNWPWSAVLLSVCALLLAGGSGRAASRTVLAFYYTWYGNPEFHNAWIHWNEGGHDPNTTLDSGVPDTGTTQHPLDGLYDSHDPATIRRHLELSEEMGVDVLIATWWGQGDYHDQAYRIALDVVDETDSPVRFCPYYETIAGRTKQQAIADLLHILDEYGGRKGSFKADGKPVIFIYGRAMGQISLEDWREVVAEVKGKHDCVLIADSGSANVVAVFDGGHWYNPVGMIVGGRDMAAAYRDFVGNCRQAGGLACTTIIPGYNDGNIGRANVIDCPRRGGQLYKELWGQAIAARPDWVAITSFNEWHEGSEIEPSVEHGRQYADLTAFYSRFFKREREGIALAPQLAPTWSLEAPPGALLDLRPAGNHALLTNVAAESVRVRATARPAKRLAALAVVEGRPHHPLAARDGEGELRLHLAPGESVHVGPRDKLASHLRRQGTSRARALAQAITLGLACELAGPDAGDLPSSLLAYPGQRLPLTVRLLADDPERLRDVVAVIEAEPLASPKLRRGAVGSRGLAFGTTVPVPRDLELGTTIPYRVAVQARVGGREVRLESHGIFQIRPPFDIALEGQLEPDGVLLLRARLETGFRSYPLKQTEVRAEGPREWQREGEVRYEDQGRARVAELRLRPQTPLEPGSRARVIARGPGYEASEELCLAAGAALGETNEEVDLRQFEWDDGTTEPAELGGRKCRVVRTRGQPSRYVYFDLADDFLRAGATYVVLEYYDAGAGACELHYDSTDPAGGPLEGAYTPGGSLSLTDSKQWRKHTFTLANARFEGRQNGGADLRFFAPEGFAIAAVEVTKSSPEGL
ncbi:MAG: hypothetical protein ACE5R4_14295 [Armatimonadota bacterium]